MSEIKRYDAMMPYMRAATDGDFLLFSDHESDCERRVADAVAAKDAELAKLRDALGTPADNEAELKKLKEQMDRAERNFAAERERCIKTMVEPLLDAAVYAEDCLNPNTDPRSSGMALYKLQGAIAVVEKAMKEKL